MTYLPIFFTYMIQYMLTPKVSDMLYIEEYRRGSYISGMQDHLESSIPDILELDHVMIYILIWTC
jgi:hypothetical protein